MFPNFIITFRETLEATLIIGIILGYLSKTKQIKYNSAVYFGTFFGILASVIGAILFSKLTNGFTGKIEETFEGVVMILASVFLTTMIIWMIKQKNITESLTKRISNNNKEQWTQIKKIEIKKIEIFLLIFFAVLREGIEIVLLLSALSLNSDHNPIQSQFLASLAGISFAIIIGYLVFKSSKKINLKLFFELSNYLLILFAAGLLAHGVHELQEAGIIPIIVEHIWDINPKVINDIYPVLHEKGIIGGFFKDLFGYNGNPSLIESITYISYISGFYILIRSMKKKKNTINIKKQKIAIVGASLNPNKYGHKIFRDMLSAKYNIVGVNPKSPTILEQKTFSSLDKIPFKPNLVITVVPPKIAVLILKECLELKIYNVWMQPGSESDEAISFAKKNKMKLTTGLCIMVQQNLW